VSIRPERIRLQPVTYAASRDETAVAGTVVEAAFVGAHTLYVVDTAHGARLSISKTNTELLGQSESFATGDRVLAVWQTGHAAEIPA
jgi:ABC-type Fe3+/spermidine/putrescine transport system ATPase subunit